MRHAARFILLLTLCSLALGCSAAARQRTIRLTYESANLADSQLRTFVEFRSKAITDDAYARCPSLEQRPACKEEARTKVEDLLSKANHAHLTVNAVIRMAGVAAILNDDQSFKALLAVAALLTAELKELGVL